jgi:hypothetical protein
MRALFEDLEDDSAVRPGPTRANDRAERPRDPALATDHLADVVFRDSELEDGRAFALNFLDLDGVRFVDELPREVRKQLSHRRSRS